MTDTRSWTPPHSTLGRRRWSEKAFELYRMLIWVYGGFLLGILSYAYGAGDDIVFWPWSSAFVLLLIGLAVWHRRRSATR